MADGVAAFPAALAAAEQINFLARNAKEGLDTILAWRSLATPEDVPAGIGSTLTLTRKGRITSTTTPSTPQSSMNIDSGMTASAYSIEQYTLTMFDYSRMAAEIDNVQQQVGIYDQLLAGARNSGVDAATTRDRLARAALFNAYMSGNTRVRTDLGAGSTTTCYVDDLRGFSTVLVNGVVTAVSATNPLTVYESGTTAQTLSVTGVTPDVTNTSTAPGGISGKLTFATATTPSQGDALVAINAPAIIRSGGAATTAALVPSNTFNLQMILDMKLALENNAVPPFADGLYRMLLDPTAQRQLMADQDFKVYFAGREDSEAIQSGYVLKLLGIEFVPTTEVYIQAPSTNGAGGTLDSVGVTVRRPMLVGAEALVEGQFTGLENYLRDLKGNPGVVQAEMVDGTVHILRRPIDALGRFYAIVWDWIGGYAVPTDLTATSAIIPTASNALFKRAVIAEIAS